MKDDQTLEGVQKALAKMERVRKRHMSKNCALSHKLNKKYKQLDWNQDYFVKSDLEDALPNTTLGVLRKMRDEKVVRCFNREFYKASNFENLFLLQELMCQMDDDYWVKPPAGNKKGNYKPFYFDSAYQGRLYLFSYPASMEWKVEPLTEFLHTKEFLFDEDSPYWKGIDSIRYFTQKFLMKCRMEKWEYQVQRYLLEK